MFEKILKTSTVIWLICIVVVMALLYAGWIQAATLYSQTNSDTASTNSTSLGTAISGGRAAYSQTLGTGISGTLASTTLYLSDSGGLSNITPAITLECYDDSAYGTYNGGCSNQFGLPAENGVGKHSVSVASVFTFQDTKYYRLGVGCTAGCSGGTNPNLITYGANFNNYLNGNFAAKLTPTSTPALGLTDMYFVLEGAFGNSITITYPPTGSTNLANFGLWYINYSLATTQTNNNAAVRIFVNSTSTVSDTSYLWFDQETKNGTAGGYTNSVLNRLPQEAFGGYVSSTVYYAVAKLYGNAGVLATSPVVNFSVGNVDAELIFPTFQSSLFATSTEPSRLCTKAPFAYWCDLAAIYSTLNASSSSSTIPALSITLPIPNGHGYASTSIAIISAANINSTLGAGNVSLLRQILVYSLWAGLALYIIERIRHIKL